jgi:hypothetical protein
MPNISRWLIDNGLGQYETTFIENDIDLGVLPDLTEADLERLGLTLGHRKKLLRAASLLQASSEGAKNAAKNVSSTPSVRPEAARFGIQGSSDGRGREPIRRPTAQRAVGDDWSRPGTGTPSRALAPSGKR